MRVNVKRSHHTPRHGAIERQWLDRDPSIDLARLSGRCRGRGSCFKAPEAAHIRTTAAPQGRLRAGRTPLCPARHSSNRLLVLLDNVRRG